MTDDVKACTGCGAPIRWVLTIAGKRMPLDPTPHPDGVVVPTLVDGTWRAKVLTGSELPAQTAAFRPHWQTCPKSDQFRRRKGATTPKCRACRTPLLQAWADDGHAYHVLCAPPSDLRAQVAAAKDTP